GAEALWRITGSPEGALPVLIEAIQGRDQGLGSFRYTFTHPAIELLAKMGRAATPAVPYLIEALHSCSETREVAARALGSIGPDAKAAVPLSSQVSATVTRMPAKRWPKP